MSKCYSFVRNCLAAVLICLGPVLFAQQATVSGKVTSADDGLGLPGVNVIEKGTSNGSVSDSDGNYTISVASNATLVFSFVGYETQEVPVNGQNTINISLRTDATVLSEIVVVGYGSQKKIDVTGAVAQVKGDDIAKQASINPISSLQGKIAGVQITNVGSPGSSPQIRIRGTGTVYGNPNPLYVVDGVWYDDISFLNPADIENISVLKDASSESIYGVRAANGVVLITTKRGSTKSNAVINYNAFVGSQVVTNQKEMANGKQFSQMINELDAINGVTPRYANPEQFGTTNWYRQILRSAFITNHQLSITGGGDKSSYNFSLGYLDQNGTVESNNYKRYTARLQNDFQPKSFLRLGYSMTGALGKSNDIDGGIFHQLYAAAPNVPVYYSDGTYGDPYDFSMGSSNAFNPQATIDYYNQQSKNYRLTGNAFAEVKFAKNFTFKTSIGGDFGQNEVSNYVPVYTATLSQRSTISNLSISRGETRNWILENTLTYDKQFNQHGVKILLGQAAQGLNSYGYTASAQNVPNTSNGDHYIVLGDPASRNYVDNGAKTTIASYFGRLNYSFNEKYLLNASLRTDGLSKFSGNQKWGVFPSVGLGWVLTEESFLSNQTIFNNLKLRGSWGVVGNSSVPANLSVLQVTQSADYTYVGGNGAISPGANISTLVPPRTYWEKGIGTDIGLEATMLKNKLFAEIGFYNRKTEKAIFDIPVLSHIGTSSGTIVGNNATFQNRGLEILLRWNDNLGSDITYSISGNVGINNNKVLEVSTGEIPIYQAVGTTGSANYNTRTVVGQPIGQFFGLKTIGVFQSQAEINAYQSTSNQVIQPNAKPGDFKYADINHDGLIDDKDRVVLGNPNPKFSYGINTNFGYKSFDLTVDMQGVAGIDIYNANLGLRYGTENFTKDFYDHRWHGDGTSNTYPSANIGGGQNYRSNSFYVESGAYFRFRNIQLGYTVPAAVASKIKLTKLRVYANAQNALNFFKYRGMTPEVGGGPTRAGVDNSVYPLYATYNLGINVTF